MFICKSLWYLICRIDSWDKEYFVIYSNGNKLKENMYKGWDYIDSICGWGDVID